MHNLKQGTFQCLKIITSQGMLKVYCHSMVLPSSAALRRQLSVHAAAAAAAAAGA
jgi:hypothetical protein